MEGHLVVLEGEKGQAYVGVYYMTGEVVNVVKLGKFPRGNPTQRGNLHPQQVAAQLLSEMIRKEQAP